jgi:hypothetical protein
LPATAARWFTLPAALAGSLALVVVTFLPFGSPLALAQRLLSEAAEGPGFSPATLLLLILQRLKWPLPIQQLSLAGLLLLGTVALWLLWRTWHGRPAWRGVADILAVYLLQALRFRIWYTSWLLPWLLLDAPREHGREREQANFRLIAGLGFLLTAQLSPLIYGHLRIFWFQRDHLPAHLVGIPFVFILPWLLALAATGYRKRSGAPQTEK